MASENLSKSFSGRTTHLTGRRNRENEPAHVFRPKAAPAEYMTAGDSEGTFHASGNGQLGTVLISGNRVDPVFIPPAAEYVVERRVMKAWPAPVAMRRRDGQGPGKAVQGCSIM